MIRESDYRGTSPDHGEDKGLAWRARQPIVPAVKAAARAWGSATAAQRCLPDYLVVGAKRSGSTTLARNLLAAEDVLPLFPAREDRKGTYFFDVHFGQGERWYRSHFPTTSARDKAADRLARPVVVGEASPYYLQHPHAARRAADLVPDVRVICVVRDPIQRAYSHWRERRKQGIEHIDTFEEALDAEASRLDGEWQRMLDDPTYVSMAHLNFGYVAQSRYLDALDRWTTAVGRQQMLVLRSEDLFASPEDTISQVRAFLGLAEIASSPAGHFNNLPGTPLPDRVIESLNREFKTDQSALERWLGHEE